ncbi:putative surface protein with fasciclin (FAS1) repeats [Antricoccus suffuscus]|uniref:Putative surface protein with fasciclin (FAS1) repeats n=2 Tax=Antricoccus suffuscus TaxID=1629062 RepID=A0A2T0Z8V8_9ACTN|nr:putative surface protein with fasciclin (FAS1) repeats [Antricoccus suffuscus]
MGDLMLSEAVAKFPGTTKFSAYLKLNTSLRASLDKAGKYAIFIPDDAAFAKLTPEQLATLDSDATLRDSMLTYMITAVPVDPASLKDAQQVPTVNGTSSPLTLTKSDTGLRLNAAATVVCGAITTARATIYLTDTVLFPPA